MSQHPAPESDQRIFRINHDWDGPDSLQVTILTAVAAVRGVEIIDLPNLHDQVNPDALERLFTNSGDAGESTDHISFVYADHRINILRDGLIILQPLP